MAASPTRPLTAFTAYLFDVDGTLVYPGQAIHGAAEALASLKRAGKRTLVVTNNSVFSRAEMAARLQGFGFPIEESDVATALVATAVFIAQERPGARVHVLGSRGLRHELEQAGLVVDEDGAGVEYLVIGSDPQVSYERLTRALRVAEAGARIVAVNLDRSMPDPRGSFPGAAMFVGAIQAGSGRGPDVVIGKPSPRLLEEVLVLLGLPADACLFVGDSLLTDVPAAHAAGMPCLLVLTGATDRAALAAAVERPEYVLETLAPLTEALWGGASEGALLEEGVRR